MSSKEHNKNTKILVLFIIALVLIVGLVQYHQSNLVKYRADALLKYGNAQDAIALYKQAQGIFPLRWDLSEDITGAQLVLRSTEDYGRIADFAELQQLPSLSALPSKQLNPNQLFVPVLMYHHIRVNPRPNDRVWAALHVSPHQLDAQLAYLAAHNYHTITLDELWDGLNGKISLPPNPIVLSFDDGYR